MKFMVLLALVFTGLSDTYAYEGREAEAEWRRFAESRIEHVRKDEVVITVLGADRGLISGAKVGLALRRHSFGFGTAVSAAHLTASNKDGQHYRDLIGRLFNKVVFENDLKWGSWDESVPGNTSSAPRRAQTIAGFRWLAEQGIAVRGHCVAWGAVRGESGIEAYSRHNDDFFREALVKHAERIVREIGNRVSEWDVVNHPVGWGREALPNRFGISFYAELFRGVAAWSPNVIRYINEGGVLPRNGYQRKKYYEMVSNLLTLNAPIQGIGFMGHFHATRDLASPREILSVFDEFSKFDLPLQVTEFDVRFGDQGQQMSLTRDQEELQADYTRDFLTAAFSHPAVTGVMLWGFWEGRHWYPSAALYRKDWSIKPNGQVWEDLVLKKWWTRESGVTGSDGVFRTRGFLGEYELTVSHAGKVKRERLTLEKGGARLTVVLPGPSKFSLEPKTLH